MKTLKPYFLAFTFLFLTFFSSKIKAQDDPKTNEKEVYVPDSLTAPIVVLSITYRRGWVFTIADGVMQGVETTIPPRFKEEYVIYQYSRLLAKACNKLAKQGYKLMTTNDAPIIGQALDWYGTVYVFQKEK